MPFFKRHYHRMPDGTIKQINPFTTTEVWCVEGRGRKEIINSEPENPEKLIFQEPKKYCHFCEGDYINTPPEKDRLYRSNGKWRRQSYIKASELNKYPAEFRRVGNLFEIVTYAYWQKNYGYVMPKEAKEWQESYLGTTQGLEHTMNILALKMRMMGKDFDNMSADEKLEKAEAFFGGSHELIVGRRHFIDNALYTHELASSGCLSEEEHYQYMKLVVDSIVAINNQNPYVRYVSVFQNWLRPAGASFDHLHKQLVGLDEWGVQLNREVKELVKNPNLYNELAANFAIYNNFVIAENRYAMAFSEIGHRYPTIAIYSKSEHSRPNEHTAKELRGISDLVHAIHRSITSQTTCNEEWYYAPFDCIYASPWHILIKLRIHNPAGFEGNTKIYINPISPEKLRDTLIEAMFTKRANKEISSKIKIGDEVGATPNPLKYYRGGLRGKQIK